MKIEIENTINPKIDDYYDEKTTTETGTGKRKF